MPIVVAAASVGNRCCDLGEYFSYSPAVPLNTGVGGREKRRRLLYSHRPPGYLAKSRNIFDCHSQENSVLPSPKVEARDPARHPRMRSLTHRMIWFRMSVVPELNPGALPRYAGICTSENIRSDSHSPGAGPGGVSVSPFVEEAVRVCRPHLGTAWVPQPCRKGRNGRNTSEGGGEERRGGGEDKALRR